MTKQRIAQVLRRLDRVDGGAECTCPAAPGQGDQVIYDDAESDAAPCTLCGRPRLTIRVVVESPAGDGGRND